MERRPDGALAINLGLFSNILLAAVKTVVGVVGHSQALLADGVNSVSDVTYYIVVKIFMRLASKPADKEHPYGHRQLESIAALVVGSFVTTTGIAILWNAIDKIYEFAVEGARLEGAAWITLWVGLATVIVKTGLMVYTRRVGQRSQNPAISALAFDHRNDVFSAAGTCIGIVLGQMGYDWADPCVAAIVALLVMKTGISILKESSASLMDAVPGEELSRQVQMSIIKVPGVLDVEECLAHHFGPYLVINLTIGIDGGMTVAQGDRIASQVERVIQERIPYLRRVHVHYHPKTGTGGTVRIITDSEDVPPDR